MRPEEIKRKAEKEAKEAEAEEEVASGSAMKTRSNIYKEYLRVENEVKSVFEKYNSKNFNVLSQQKIGSKFEVDLVLKAKSREFSDRIVEVKYFRNSIRITTLQKALFQLSRLSEYYKTTTNKLLVPVLLVVYNSKETTKEKIVLYDKRLLSYSKEIEHLDRLKVEFLDEQNIQNYDVKRILKR